MAIARRLLHIPFQVSTISKGLSRFHPTMLGDTAPTFLFAIPYRCPSKIVFETNASSSRCLLLRHMPL